MRLYEKIAETDIEKVPFVYREIELLNKKTTNAIDATDKIANRMHLYFDFDEYIEKEEYYLDLLLDVSTEIRALDSEMEIKSKIFQEYDNNEKMQEIIIDNMKEKLSEYIPKLKELVELGNRAQAEARRQLTKIKMEMKKYDL